MPPRKPLMSSTDNVREGDHDAGRTPEPPPATDAWCMIAVEPPRSIATPLGAKRDMRATSSATVPLEVDGDSSTGAPRRSSPPRASPRAALERTRERSAGALKSGAVRTRMAPLSAPARSPVCLLAEGILRWHSAERDPDRASSFERSAAPATDEPTTRDLRASSSPATFGARISTTRTSPDAQNTPPARVPCRPRGFEVRAERSAFGLLSADERRHRVSHDGGGPASSGDGAERVRRRKRVRVPVG